MHLALLLTTAALLSQAPETTLSTDADSARRAAEAAERAAAAAERSAKAAEEIAARLVPAAPVEQKPAAPEAPAKPQAWSGTLGLSFIALSGNAETLTFSTSGAGERRWKDWVVGAQIAAAYGQTRVTEGDEPQVVALSALAQLRGDRKVTEATSVFLLAGGETDHVKSVEFRAYGEGGAAIRWVERKSGDAVTLLVRTDLGLRYAHESRFQYFPTPLELEDVVLVAPKLGFGFRYALNENVSIVEEAEVLTNVAGESRVLVNSLTRVNARISGPLAFTTGFQVNFDSEPAEGKRPTDTILSAGIELSL